MLTRPPLQFPHFPLSLNFFPPLRRHGIRQFHNSITKGSQTIAVYGPKKTAAGCLVMDNFEPINFVQLCYPLADRSERFHTAVAHYRAMADRHEKGVALAFTWLCHVQ